MRTTAMLTDTEWRHCADAFGITDAELQEYKQAFADLDAVGLQAFIDMVYDEALSAVARIPVSEATLRRMLARRDVVQAAVEASSHDALRAFDGPMH